MVGEPVTFAGLAPAFVEVVIRDTTFGVRGLSGKTIVEIATRHPAIIGLFTGKIDAAGLLSEVPETGCDFVLHGMRKPDDEQLRQSFHDDLVIGEQLDLVNGVLKASLPRGRGPFEDLMRQFGLEPAMPAEPLTNSAAASGSPSSRLSSATDLPSTT
jgi:hypothetical protein